MLLLLARQWGVMRWQRPETRLLLRPEFVCGSKLVITNAAHAVLRLKVRHSRGYPLHTGEACQCDVWLHLTTSSRISGSLHLGGVFLNSRLFLPMTC